MVVVIRKGKVSTQPLIFFHTTPFKKIGNLNRNEKGDIDTQSALFRVIDPVYRFIALRGSPQRRGRRLCRCPEERDAYLLE